MYPAVLTTGLMHWLGLLQNGSGVRKGQSKKKMNYVSTVVEIGSQYSGAHDAGLCTFVLCVFKTLCNKQVGGGISLKSGFAFP